MSGIELIGLGALNMDCLYRVERILEDGETVVEEPQAFPGGSAANTVYGLARLGVRTGFVGVVGGDAFGERVLEDFRAVGVDTSRIKKITRARTGYTLCLSDRAGRRSIYVVPGANDRLSLDEADLFYIKQARALHISSFAGEKQFGMLMGLVGAIREESPLLSFSPGAIYARRGLAALAPIISSSQVLFVNKTEIEQLTGEDMASGAAGCIRQGCGMVVVTLGKGARLGERFAAAYIRDARKEYTIEPVEPERPSEPETTGAGDAFAAGFLFGMLRSESPEECGRLGGILAAFKISRPGARTGLPAFSELSRRYRELYGKQL